MDLALQVAASKLAVSIVLGGLIWLLHRGRERPRLSHALCLTLLAALLIPPLIALPVLNPAAPDPGPVVAVASSEVQPVATLGAAGSGVGAGYRGSGLVLIWILGAVAGVGWTMARARAFRSSLQRALRDASPDLRRMAEKIGGTLGLARVPAIHTTDAVVSPMVYWSGGTARVLIPSALLEGMKPAELRWILAHELAHVRRRDHLVRWLEWLACTAFWWNPIAWWARRRLRAAGEVCCDALVVSALDCAPRDYARSLVRAVDLVRAERTTRPPAFASAAHSGRRTENLERRLRMLITRNPTATLSPALRVGLRCGLVVLLASGLVYCSERTSPTAVEVPTLDASLADLSTEGLDVVEVPPAEALPGVISMAGKTYGELKAALEGLSCASCHTGDQKDEGGTIPLSLRTRFRSMDGGGWSVEWEFSANLHDKSESANPRATSGITKLSSWFPPGTIERVVVDQPPPPGW